MTCAHCDLPVDVAITTRTPANKQGVVSTIYQFPEDAPKRATGFYCVKHGIEIAAGLARLSNPKGADE